MNLLPLYLQTNTLTIYITSTKKQHEHLKNTKCCSLFRHFVNTIIYYDITLAIVRPNIHYDITKVATKKARDDATES